MKRPIYLDYAATTPVDPQVAERMMECLTFDGTFGNAASRSHAYGWQGEGFGGGQAAQVEQAVSIFGVHLGQVLDVAQGILETDEIFVVLGQSGHSIG